MTVRDIIFTIDNEDILFIKGDEFFPIDTTEPGSWQIIKSYFGEQVSTIEAAGTCMVINLK
jgi:hypothetical protein